MTEVGFREHSTSVVEDPEVGIRNQMFGACAA